MPPARVSKNRNDPFWFVVAGACAKLSWIWSFMPERSMLMPALNVWLPVTFVTLSVHRNTKSFQDPGYAALLIAVKPSSEMFGILSGSSFVPGNRYG